MRRSREQITRDRYRILQAVEGRPTSEPVPTTIVAYRVQRPIDIVRRDLYALEAEGFVRRGDWGGWY